MKRKQNDERAEYNASCREVGKIKVRVSSVYKEDEDFRRSAYL